MLFEDCYHAVPGTPVGRCGHSACLWAPSPPEQEMEFPESECMSTKGLQIIVFGGCGGVQYERTALADVWSLDCGSWVWQKHTFTGTVPAAR